ncbi:Hypothetical Protein XCAW_00702 [Xanthomonas citri subsp. citri Aw12879]|nr:Hypothetical Protein XCAW_00702 [Xanthomonas citri subsp. citri Aw12879]
MEPPQAVWKGADIANVGRLAMASGACAAGAAAVESTIRTGPRYPKAVFLGPGVAKNATAGLRPAFSFFGQEKGPEGAEEGAAASRMLAGRTLTPTPLPQKRGFGIPFSPAATVMWIP